LTASQATGQAVGDGARQRPHELFDRRRRRTRLSARRILEEDRISKPLPEWCPTVGDPNAPWPGRCSVPTILASVPGVRAELFHRCSLKARHSGDHVCECGGQWKQ